MMKVNSNKRGSRGFTVAELVVALAIIVIVSATAISLVHTQNTIHLRTTQTIEATNMAENAIECFRFAVENPETNIGEDKNGVVEAFYNAFVLTGYLDSDKYTAAQESYEIESNGMIVKITITVAENKIDIYAHDGDKDLLNKSYTCTK